MAESKPFGPEKPLWQRRWFQILLATLVALVVLSFLVPPIFLLIYEVRSVLVPVVIAFGLAYVANPAITSAHRRYRIPRWAGAASIMALGLLILMTALLLILPPLIAQGTDLVVKAKEVYPQRVADWMSTPGSPAPGMPPGTVPGSSDVGTEGPATDPDAPPLPEAEPGPLEAEVDELPEEEIPGEGEGLLGSVTGLLDRVQDPEQVRLFLQTVAERLRELEWSQVAATVRRSLDIGVGVVGTAIGFTTYLMLAAVIIVCCFFFFAWKFDHITGWFVPFIPASHREETLRVVHRMDQTIAAFVRGRLIQALVMMIILSVGWLIVGVPYWLLLGVLGGVLNLVPFIAVVAWILALILTLIDHTTGTHGFTIWTLILPTIVYVVAQSVDGWVVEPVVQGQATNLDPVTVLLVVLVGGALAGLLGMLIAIPTAACIKILCQDVVLPRLRRLAAEH